MNQQAFNLLGAIIAIAIVAGIWSHFSRDAVPETPVPEVTPSAPRTEQAPAYRRYRVDYSGLSLWFDGEPEIVVTHRPGDAIQTVYNRQEALLSAILGESARAPAQENSEIESLKGIVLNPVTAFSVSWRNVVGESPPVDPAAIAKRLLALSPQDSLRDDFTRLVRGINSSSISHAVEDINRRVKRWRDMYSTNPIRNSSVASQNQDYLVMMEAMALLLQHYYDTSYNSPLHYTREQAQALWPDFEKTEMPRLTSFVDQSSVETIRLLTGNIFETTYVPGNYVFFLRGTVHGHTIYIQMLPKKSALITWAGQDR